MYSYSEFIHNYNKSDFKYVEPISEDYRVFLNGEEIPVYTCRISKIPFNRPWPGYQRSIDQTEVVSFVNIVSDEAVKLDVHVNKDYQNIMIRPYSKAVEYTDDNGKVSFTLKENGQFVFSCDDLHGCLYIFNSKPIPAPSPESVTHFFGPGVHMPGKITLKSCESVYIDKDALVFGCVYAEDAENIRIFGNGLLDDSSEARFCRACYENYVNGNIKFYDCKNISIEGVLMRDSAIWCCNIYHCSDVVIDGIKIFGQWRYNTDGVDIINSRNVELKNSFIHSFDDSVVIKGIDRYIEHDCENIVTDNCTVWCDWGKTLEIGLETSCRKYKNIVFRNCDIIRAGNTALDIQNGDIAEVSDILYENINVEYNSFDNVPVLQESDDQVYNSYDEVFVPWLIRMENYRYRSMGMFSNFSVNYPPIDLSDTKQTCVHDVTIRGINLIYDEKIPKRDGKYNVALMIKSFFEDTKFYNISISGITLNGSPLKLNDTFTEVVNVENFIFE